MIGPERRRALASLALYAGAATTCAGGATWPRPAAPVVAAGLALLGLGIALRRAAGPPPLEPSAGGPGTPLPDRGNRDGAPRPPAPRGLAARVAWYAREVDALAAAAEVEPAHAVLAHIEALNAEGPDRVGAAFEAIAARVGFAAYADVMAPLATAERLLNRAWSAAADGHAPECRASIEAARAYAGEAAGLAATRFRDL